jgi:hypothetical protein
LLATQLLSAGEEEEEEEMPVVTLPVVVVVLEVHTSKVQRPDLLWGQII